MPFISNSTPLSKIPNRFYRPRDSEALQDDYQWLHCLGRGHFVVGYDLGFVNIDGGSLAGYR
ncbi:MAG: hypothetical protein DCF22_20715 [Leptolyngbya sp.]|nr:MAG: hypothetical protein DCF22_20715 [Leptolyngbya sp.]